MTTPTKPNDVTTPLSVKPGDPHWSDKNHDQVDAGPAYDYHDPVSLQRGGYSTGNAITMFGKVGFRADQIVANVDHGNILLLELTRRFGTQGEFDFFISYNAIDSTGILGDFRTDVEHGFDVCKIDLDLLTLNPEVSAAGPGRFRIRFKDGESRKTLQVIAPYRTAVRTFDAVTVQKPVTYWVKELAHAFAGVDEAEKSGSRDDYVFLGNQGANGHDEDYHPEARDPKWTNRPHDLASITRTAELLHDIGYYTSRVRRHDVNYKVLTLPLPASFVAPPVGIPESETWKDQFPVYNHDRLEYTVGNSYDTVVYARMYTYPTLVCDSKWIGGPSNWGAPGAKRICYERRGSWIYTHNWSEGVGAYLPNAWGDGMGQVPSSFDRSATVPRANGFVAGDSSWKDDYDFVYGNHDHTGYQSVLAELDQADPQSFWQNNYTAYDNPQLGDIFTIGGPIEHLNLTHNSYNVMFNHVGVAGDRTIYKDTLTMYVSSPTQPTNQQIAPSNDDRVPGAPRDLALFPKGYDLRAGGYFHFVADYENQMSGDFGAWVTNDISLSGKSGVGQSGTSNVLYDLSNLAHDSDSYKLNDNLHGYYKCCVDHTNREIHLTLDKADYNDPVELDEVITSAIYVNKATTYDVEFHAAYDDTVQIDHAIDPSAVLEPSQAWDDTPTGDSLVEQIFVPEGAMSTSQVQFVSLSAGALGGGMTPRSKQPRPKPVVAPTLTLTVPWNSRATVDDLTIPQANLASGDVEKYVITMTNTGGQELTLEFNPDKVSGNELYDNTVTPVVGDKIDDFTVSIQGIPSIQQGGSTNSYVLSSGAALELTIDLVVQTQAGAYDVWIPYSISKPGAGIDTGQITYKATVS